MKKNKKNMLLCLICLLFPLLVSAETAYVKIYPGDDLKVVCSFFDRPSEEVKRDILATLENLNSPFEGSDHNKLLHLASVNGTPEILKFMLDNGADIEVRDGSSGTPLYAAAMTGRADSVKILLEYGANPNCNCPDNPIHTAFTGYIRFLLNDIDRRKGIYPKELYELSKETRPCRPRSYQEYGIIIQMLWPVTQLEEKILETWKNEFYFDLRSQLTTPELDKEWAKFLSIIPQDSDK